MKLSPPTDEDKFKVLQMFLEYSESNSPYISRTYISTILDISVNKVITILNNLLNEEIIEYDAEINKYRLRCKENN